PTRLKQSVTERSPCGSRCYEIGALRGRFNAQESGTCVAASRGVNLRELARQYVPEALRGELRRFRYRAHQTASIARPWRWELVKMRRAQSPHDVAYAGSR